MYAHTCTHARTHAQTNKHTHETRSPLNPYISHAHTQGHEGGETFFGTPLHRAGDLFVRSGWDSGGDQGEEEDVELDADDILRQTEVCVGVRVRVLCICVWVGGWVGGLVVGWVGVCVCVCVRASAKRSGMGRRDRMAEPFEERFSSWTRAHKHTLAR